jgi:hypothetical protein
VKFDDGKGELTDLERLRMKTRKLQQQPRLNIRDFQGSQTPKPKPKPQQTQQKPESKPDTYGPVGQPKSVPNNDSSTSIPKPQTAQQPPETQQSVLRGPVEVPQQQTQQQPEQQSTAAQKAAQNVNMTDQEFRDMLARNLQRTDLEKARRGYSLRKR